MFKFSKYFFNNPCRRSFNVCISSFCQYNSVKTRLVNATLCTVNKLSIPMCQKCSTNLPDQLRLTLPYDLSANCQLRLTCPWHRPHHADLTCVVFLIHVRDTGSCAAICAMTHPHELGLRLYNTDCLSVDLVSEYYATQMFNPCECLQADTVETNQILG